MSQVLRSSFAPKPKLAQSAGALAALGLLALAGVSGCDDGDQFAEVEAVELLVDPPSIAFPSSALGEETQQSLLIINQSDATAKLDIQLLEERTQFDEMREFGWAEGSVPEGTVSLAGGEQLQLWVSYTPMDEYNDMGRVEINYNGGKQIVVPVTTNDIAPDIDGPDRVIIGRVPAGQHAQKRFKIQNVGFAPLTLESMRLTNTSADVFSVCMPMGEGENVVCDSDNIQGLMLDAEETLDIQINYDPIDDIEDSAILVIASDDPDEPDFEIPISANGEEPCILVTDEDGIDFATAQIGAVSSRTITITNCSPSKELEVSGIAITEDSDSTFSLGALPSPLPDDAVKVPIDGTASFVLQYAPEGETANEGRLEIRSNDAAKSPLIIPINGRGSNNVCPTAIARASVNNSPPDTQIDTIPLQTVRFDATMSTDPDGGTIEGYEWTIVESPPDSTSRFVPRDNIAEPQLFLDLAGIYRVQLRVFDNLNTPSCEVSEITIHATPDEDIHVQLVWETPGDPDETDSGFGDGSDVDLHFLHQTKPGARWDAPAFESPWDCHWQNRNPVVGDWDPSLDIDDTDGAGPENINLNGPEDAAYRVGVYYFNDHGYGPAYVTIRIFLQANLVFEYRDKFLDGTGRFWDVASVNWPSATVDQVDQLYNDFP